MDIREKIIKHVDNFVIENKEQISNFKPIKNIDGLKPASRMDYIPNYWEYEKEGNDNPLNSPLVEKLTNEVLELVFGKKEERESIKFYLRGHIENLDGKSWKEVDEYEASKNDYKTFSYDTLIKTFKVKILIDMIESAFFKNEDKYDFRLYDFSRNRLTQLFSICHCFNCGKNVDIFFDFNEKRFESNEYFKECPKFNPLMKFTLKVPSKRLVILNDIREAFVVNREDEYSPGLDCVHGKIRECEEYVKHNMAYICLSSGGIDVIQNDNDKLIVMDFNKNTYYKVNDETSEREVKEDFKKIGSISLDLWAVFMIDFDHYKKICEEKGFDIDDFEPVYVSISNDSVDVKYHIDKLIVEMKY